MECHDTPVAGGVTSTLISATIDEEYSLPAHVTQSKARRPLEQQLDWQGGSSLGGLKYNNRSKEKCSTSTKHHPLELKVHTQHVLIRESDKHSLSHRTSRKRPIRLLSNCLFYTIFGMGVLSFSLMEFYIRNKYSNLSALMMVQTKDEFVGTAKDTAGLTSMITPNHNDIALAKHDAAKEVQFGTSRYKQTLSSKEYVSQEVRYASRSEVSHFKAPHRYSYATTKFSQDAELSMNNKRMNSWALDPFAYANEGISSATQPRVFYIDPNMHHYKPDNEIYLDIFELSINTQAYPILDSKDIDTPRSEIGPQDGDGECVPMKEWQTTSYPACNKIHEIDFIQQSHPNWGGDIHLFGTNGYWRNAWKVDYSCNDRNMTHIAGCNETVVLKTLKLQHNFEHAQHEHNRIDAMAMERLTSSPHVINIFGACANSILTEFADGERVGAVADKSKKNPLARLKIARDIASGLADVHSIDGDGVATFVHFDVNLANVVTIGRQLKLNDFNIGVILKRNTTSGEACGFPAKYPNPQWRSPEEANDSQYLTEKVDVYSLGHIFFRLICLHEPWHKLEPGYTKGDEIRNEYVKEQVKKGVLPFIPKAVVESKDAEVRLIREAMLACYTFDPEKRPSARSIANFLDRGIAELSKYSFHKQPGRNYWGSFRLGKK